MLYGRYFSSCVQDNSRWFSQDVCTKLHAVDMYINIYKKTKVKILKSGLPKGSCNSTGSV
jgi:hypothetical protein